MSEKRFVSEYVEIIDENGSRQAVCVTDNEHTVSFEVKDEYVAMDLCKKLNEQQATIRRLQDLCGKSDYENVKLRQEIKELKAQLREKEEDERLYANEIVKLNKEAKEVLDFKSLGGDY